MEWGRRRKGKRLSQVKDFLEEEKRKGVVEERAAMATARGGIDQSRVKADKENKYGWIRRLWPLRKRLLIIFFTDNIGFHFTK